MTSNETAAPPPGPAPKARPAKRPLSRGRRVFRWAFRITVGLVALALGLAAAVLWTDYGTRLAVEEALTIVNDSVPGNVEVGSVEGTLADGLVLNDVVIRDPDGKDALRLARLSVRVGLWDLMGQRVRVEELSLSGLDVALFDRRDRLALARAFVTDTVTPDQESDPSSWTIDVESIHLGDVDIAGTEGGPVWVRGLALDAAVLLTPTEMRWRDVTLTGELVHPPLPTIPTGPFRVTTAGGTEGDHLRVERFTADVGGVALDLSADLPRLGDTAGTVTLHGLDADFAALAKWLPDTASLRGKPSLQGELRSDGERLTAKLSMVVGETSVSIDAAATVWPRLGGWRLRVDGQKLRPDETLASLSGIAVERLRLQLDGDGTPLTPASQVTLQLSAEGLAIPSVSLARAEAQVTLDGARAVARFDVLGDALGFVSGQVEMPDVLGPAVVATVDLRDVDLTALPPTLGMSGLTGRIPQLQIVADVRLLPGAAPSFGASIDGRFDGVQMPASFGGHAIGSALIDAELDYPGAGLPTGEARLTFRDVTSGELAASAVVIDVAADVQGHDTRVGVQVTTHGVRGPAGLALEDGHVTAEARVDADWRVQAGHLVVRGAGVRHGPWHLGGLAFSGRLSPSLDVGAGAIFEGPLTLTAASGPDGLGIGEIQGTVGVALGDRLAPPKGQRAESPLGLKGGLHFDAVRLGAGRNLRHLEATVDATWSSQGLGGTLGIGAESLQLGGLTLDDASLVAHLGQDERGRLDVRGRRGNLRAGASVGVAFPKGLSGPVDVQLFEAFARKGPIGVESIGIATLRYDPAGGAAVERLRLKLAGTSGTALSVDGNIALETGQLNATIAMPKQLVKPWLELGRALSGDPAPLPKVAGTIALSADVHGTPERLLGDARLTLTDARVGRTRGLSGDVNVALGRESATATVAASWGDARLTGTLNAPWPLRDGARTSLTLTSSPFELERLGKLVKAARGLRGLVRVDAQAEGAWPRVEGRIALTGTRVEAPGVAPLDFELTASLDDGVARSSLRAGVDHRLRVELEAPLSLDALARGAVRVMDTALTARIELAPTRVGELVTGLAPAVANLNVGGDVRLSGAVASLRVDGKLHATRGLLGDREVTVELGPDGPGSRITAHVGASGQPLAQATVSLAEPIGAAALKGDPRALLTAPTTTLVVTTDALDQSALDALVPGLGAQLAALVGSPTLKSELRFRGGPAGPSGTVHVDLSAGGSAAMLAAATVDVTVKPESTELRVSATTPPMGPEANAGVFDVVTTVGVGGAMAIGGEADPISARRLSGRVRVVALPIAAVSALAPGVLGPSEGQIDVDVAIGGTVGKPTLQGDATAALQRLVVSPLGLDQTDVRVAVSLRDDRIRLGPVKLVNGASALTLDLAAQLAGGAPRDIALSGVITLDRYPVLGREDLAASLSGDIALAGTLAAPAVNARLRLDEVAVRPATGGRDLEPLTAPDGIVFVGTAAPRPEDDAAPELSGIAEGLVLDLAIEIPTRAVHVRNDMVDLRASGDLRITSREAALGIVGHVGVDEGRVFVYGREFAISPDSKVIFDGSEQLDPALDVRATFDISGVDLTTLGPNLTGKVITLEVSGNASRPKVALRSDPEMTETNIMSIITLGFPAGGAPGATGAGEDSARIANLVMGLVSASASRMIQDKLPVDVFKIETGSSQLSDTRITVGRRILRNLMVAYHADLGAREGENTNEIRVQYELTRRLHLDGRYGDGRAGALDLFYRWRF